MYVQSYFKQLCMILTYVHVNVLSHSKHCVFVTSNERMAKKNFKFYYCLRINYETNQAFSHFKDTVRRIHGFTW